MEEVYGLSRQAKIATEKTCNIVLGSLSPLPKSPRGTFDQEPVYYAKATSAIDTGTFESPSTGTATVWVRDSDSVDEHPPLVETTNTKLTDITIFNPWSITITSDTQLLIGRRYGEWVILWADC